MLGHCTLELSFLIHDRKLLNIGTTHPILASCCQQLRNLKWRWECKMKRIVGSLPWHAFNIHSLASVAFPGQVSLPPMKGLLHCRARNSVPRPQEVVHWVQEPQSNHSAVSSGNTFASALTMERITPAHTDEIQLSVCVGSPSQVPTHPRALIRNPWPQECEHWDQATHSCQPRRIPR